MKILFIADDITIFGGAERVIINLANALCEIPPHDNKHNSKNEIEIFSLHHSNKYLPYYLNSNIKVSFYTQPISKNEINQIKNFNKQFISKLKVIVFKLKFLFLNFNLLKTDEALRRMLSAKISQSKCDIVIDNTGYSYCPFYKKQNTKYIMLTHTSYSCKITFVNHQYLNGLKQYDTLVILSPCELSLWQRYHHNIKVIPNFLPTIPQVATNHSQKVVLSVGRFSSEKGFLRLIDIWKIVRDSMADSHNGTDLREWQLIIVGDGVLKGEIESKIRTLNLGESVILKPFTKDIEREYLGASIYAMASHFEGFGMVLAEASSYALPCIAFDIATGPSDIIQNNTSGFLIADNDLQGYADKLITLMSDENLRAKFGAEAKRLVGERFSKEAIIKRWQTLFDENWSKR